MRVHVTLAPVCAWRASRSGGAGRARFVWGLLKPPKSTGSVRFLRGKRDYSELKSVDCVFCLASATSAGNLLLMICHRSLGSISSAFTSAWLKIPFCSPERGMYDSLQTRDQSVVENKLRFWQLSPPRPLKTLPSRFIVGTGSFFSSLFGRSTEDYRRFGNLS